MIRQKIENIRQLLPHGVQLVCVTKYHTVEEMREAYDAGERDFAESRVQEFLLKRTQLPEDVRWHFIGHLQTNKVRQLMPYVSLIQSVDSFRLLQVIEDEAAKAGRAVDVLLEVHVAQEDSKTGFSEEELTLPVLWSLSSALPHVRIRGLMTMASHTADENRIRDDFRRAAALFRRLFPQGGILSMGMSNDYAIAVEEGANMVRLGSCIFE